MKPDHPDTLSRPITCQHCAAVLRPGERFCPACGEDRDAPPGTGRVDAMLAVEQAASDELDTLSPLEEDEGVPSRPKAHGAAAAASSIAADTARVPADDGHRAFWQAEEPRPGLWRWIAGLGAIGRLALSLLAVLLVLGGVLAIDRVRTAQPHPATRLQAFASGIAQVQGALARGDLDAARRMLGALEAEHPDAPGLQALREDLDLRTREQAARREQLRAAARKAVQTLGLNEPPADGTAAPAQAPATTEASTRAGTVAGSAVASDATAAPQTTACSEALSALSLCAPAGVSPPRPDASRLP